MKMKIVDRTEKKAVSARSGTKTIRKRPRLLLFLLLSVTFGISGCDEYYGAHPGYDRFMGVMGHTDPVTLLTQALSPSRLAIDPIIPAALVIMWAGPITSG